MGATVVKHLTLTGHTVRILVRKDHERDLLKDFSVEKVYGDIISPQAVDYAIEGCDVVFHLASVYALYPWWAKEDETLFQVNVCGTRNVLRAALRHNTQRVIITSSVASIGSRSDNGKSDEETIFNFDNTSSQYARSKVLAEYEVLKYCARGVRALILNPAIIFGEGDCRPTPSGSIILNFLNKKYHVYFDGTISVVDVDDVARAHISAIDHGTVGERYILCHDRSYTLKEIFDLLEEISGVKAPSIKITSSFIYPLVCIDEIVSNVIFKRNPSMSSEGIKFCRPRVSFNNAKAVKELHYSSRSLRETLIKAVYWYKEHGYVKNNGR